MDAAWFEDFLALVDLGHFSRVADVAWHLGLRHRDFFRRWAFWLETEAGSSLRLVVNVRLDLRIPFQARPRFR